jgi:hypothetical protein
MSVEKYRLEAEHDGADANTPRVMVAPPPPDPHAVPVLAACVDVPLNCAHPAAGVAVGEVTKYSPDVLSFGSFVAVAVLESSTLMLLDFPEVLPVRLSIPVLPDPLPLDTVPVTTKFPLMVYANSTPAVNAPNTNIVFVRVFILRCSSRFESLGM